MIIIDIILHSAITAQRSYLGRIKIFNDGTGTQQRGNYTFIVYAKNGRKLKTGKIENWPRQSKTALALLQKAINTAYPTTS